MFSVLFPGQGSQFLGMGIDLYKRYDLVKSLFNKVDSSLGYPLSKIILNGPENQLNLTQNTQPAIMVIGVSIFKLFKEEFNINLNNAKFFAGHSLGEYTALVCANSLKIETAAFLLHERGKSMQKSVPVGHGSMMAILGMTTEEILKEIKLLDSKGVCEIANENCPGQIVVSGNIEEINNLSKNLKQKSKRGIILPVSAPFHCSLMKKAAIEMETKIKNSELKTPKPSIISNVTAKPEDDPSTIKDLLIRQITSKVRWSEIVEYMIKNDVNKFIEIGPGKVLSGLVKRINKSVKVLNINSVEDIKSYISND